MGKYIRKAKTAGPPDLAAAMESSLGVRTRAKTLAAAASSSGGLSHPPSPSANYLQLRSRRLLKPPIAVSKRQRQQTHKEASPSPNPIPRASSRLRPASSESVGSFVNNNNNNAATAGEGAQKKEPADAFGCREDSVADNENKACSKCELGCAGEASFGDNGMEFEGRDRGTRESTPCSLVRDPDVIRTPGSSTRPTAGLTGANRRVNVVGHRHIPTSNEMDEFFASAEEEQQRSFTEKYNFDPVNEKPLPGRYEWEKLEPNRDETKRSCRKTH